MTTNKRTDCWRGTVLALLAAALLLWPVTALAWTACPVTATTTATYLCSSAGLTASGTQDCDNDGITNAQECSGFTTAGQTRKTVAGYTSTAAVRLDPTKPDLFYMVTDIDGNELATGSLLLAALGSNPDTALNVYSNGLNVRTHRVTLANCTGDRLLITGTSLKAARIKESISTSAEGTYLGSTPQSKPSDQSVASTIYTQKIKDDVDKNCPTPLTPIIGTTACSVRNTSSLVTNGNGTNNTPIINYYIRQVVSHEMGHGTRLAGTTARTYYHHSRSGTIMDPAASFSGGVYTIPTGFNTTPDLTALTLK